MKAIVGRKMGMTEVFAEDGTMYPVTVVEVLPNVLLKLTPSHITSAKNYAVMKWPTTN